MASDNDVVKRIGERIIYVDPNDIYGFGDDNNEVPLTPPYEDMCIAFNLIIEKYDRFDANVRKEIGMEWTDKPNGQTSHFSVLDGELKDNGGNSYLTTYYTEISPEGYKKKEMVEGLGVQAIQVNFDSYYTPTVVIKFVDVRGSALFGREETIHTDANGSGVINANNIFGAFFTIPYPKFRLQIKGFYGRDVTYQLTCSNFKANFNAKTGNVEATATFVGYTWSLLTDIPLAYLIAAPYCNYEGASYWAAHKTNEEWQMDNTDQSNATTSIPPTLYEFFNAIRECIKGSTDIASGGSSNSNASSSISDERGILNEIKTSISEFEKLTTSKKKDDINKKKDDISNAFRGIITNVENYKNNNNQNAFENITIPKNPYEEKSGNEYEIADFKALKNEINNKLALLDKATESLIKEERRQFVVKSLRKIGIDPNIKNIFKILMCHLETFCHILFKAGAEIESQKSTGERTPSYLGVQIDNTDMPERFGKDTALPAWTAIFNHNSNNDSTDELKYKDMYQWVGNISDKWIEERVVWSLQNAIQQTMISKNENEVSKTKTINSILSLPSDINLPNSTFSNVSLLGFDTICGSLALRASQIFGIMDTTLENNISMVKTLGEIDAYNYYLSCHTTDDIKSQILEKIDNGNATEIITGVTTCNTTYDTYCDKKNNDGSVYHIFEIDRDENNKRQPLFLKENNGYKYVYFNDVNNKSIVPSVLVDFKNRGYNEFIKPISNNNVLCYNGVTEGDKTKGWFNTDNSQIQNGIKNYDMFNIIDDEGYINALISKYDKIKSGSFKIKNYEVNNEEGFKNFIDRYWHLSYDEYKKMFPNKIGCTFIGKSYSTYFDNNEHKKPEKNYWIKDKFTWSRALDGNLGNTQYSIGDDYNKLKDDSEELEVDKLFIKSLYVLNTNGNSVGTLFGYPFYYTQNQITDSVRCRNAKAFLFLQSLARSHNYFDNSFNTMHGSFTIYNKLNILYIGGLLWRQKYYDENGVDGIKYDNPSGGPKYSICVKNGKILTIGGELGLTIYPKGKDDKGGEKDVLDSHCITIGQYLIKNNISLDENIKEQLIEYFEKFARTDFSKIAAQCEIRLKYNGEFKAISDGKSFNYWLDKATGTGKLKDHEQLTPADAQLYGNCYAFLYCNMEGDNPSPTGVYMLFDEENSKEVQKIIKDVFFGKVIIMNNGSVNKSKNGLITIKSNVYETYITTFIDTLRTIHSSQTNNIDEYASTNLTDNMGIDENLLLAIYLYCKNIWEKWLLPMAGESSEEINLKNGDMNENHFDVSHFFKNFIFIDSYYNDIGRLLKINLDSLLKSYEGRSVEGNLFSFIGDIVADHRCLFVGLPDYVHLGLGINGENAGGLEKMKDMFKPIPYSKMGKPRMDNHFVVIYTYPPASKLPESLSHKYDGFDIYATDIKNNPCYVEEANKNENITDTGVTKYGYNIPAFAVAFAKQNNHLFKDFSISMDNPVETEQSIKTLYHVAELAKGNDRKVCFYGQDVYNIFSNYSYQIEVEMMGNAQIQPLMYFQLLNIPMWRGAYMIFNVSHNMTPGNMTTRFKAMKMSKNPVPILSSYWSWIPEAMANGDNPYSGDYSDASVGGEFGSLPDKVSSPKEDYLSKSENHSIANTQSVSSEMRNLFNQLYEEIMNMEDNGNSDKSKMKWNIYATSGYRPKDRCRNGGKRDHALGATLDIHISKWNNGKFSSVHNSGGAMREGYKVLALLRKNHLTQLNDGHVLIEYSSKEYFETNKDTNSLAMLHISVKKGCSSDAGPFVIAINGLGGYYRYAVTNLNLLGGVESYLNKIHPDLKALCKNDFYSLGRSEFNKIWQGVIPMSASDNTLKTYFGAYDSNSSNSNINTASGGKSIFQTNSKYDFNAVCRPEGYFAYTFDNMKKCVLYFVAHGEGGNRNPTGKHSTDYCGINESNKSFYNSTRTTVLNSTPQNGFVAQYDNDVFNFYFNEYYISYKDFLTNCKNPYCRYAGLLCLKGGSGFADSAWRSVLKKYGIKSCSFSSINEDSKNALRTNNAFTQTLANTFFDKLFANYPSYNGGKENTTGKFKQYNKIYS